LTIENTSARVDSTVAESGTLDSLVREGAELISSRFRQNGLTLASGATAVILPDGTVEATSVLTSLSIGEGAKLDIRDNVLIVDYSGTSPEQAIRDKIIEGRGHVGIGNGNWTGAGIMSSSAAAFNALLPEMRSIGYADNASFPLGRYYSFGGRALDDTSVVIALTVTGDANLDGKVDDNDATIIGATYGANHAPTWAHGDFDYSGSIGDDDVTLVGALYKSELAFAGATGPAPPQEVVAGRGTVREALPAARAMPTRSLAGALVDYLLMDRCDGEVARHTGMVDELATHLAEGRRHKRVTLFSSV
jgi:hypothetical protein